MLCQEVSGILRHELKTLRQDIFVLMRGTSETSHHTSENEPWTIPIKTDADKLTVTFEGAALQQELEPTPRQHDALVKSILPSSEPHASNSRTGARWARMAQAIWHVDEARLKIKTAQQQQESDVLDEVFRLIGKPQSDYAGNLCTDGMFEAAQAYNLVLTSPALLQSRILSSALQALRNNVTLRFCCRNGTCNFTNFEEELLRVFGAGRVGMKATIATSGASSFTPLIISFLVSARHETEKGSVAVVQRSLRMAWMHQLLRP